MRGAWQRMARTGLVAGAVVLSHPGRAAEIRVVDEAEKPLADVMVACTKGSKDAGLSGADGLVKIADPCTEVYCDRGDRVNDLVRIVDGKATCHVRTGVVLTVVAPRGTCPEGCQVSVRNRNSDFDPKLPGAVEGGVPRRISRGFLSWDEPEQNHGREARERIPGRWKSKPIAAGPLTVELTTGDEVRVADGIPYQEKSPWYCRTDLGTVAPGPSEVTVVWRAPLEVRGSVLDRAGKPVSDVPLFVKPEATATGGAPVWTCSSWDRNGEPVSGADGSFQVRIDPAVPVRIEAGWKNYPIGTASLTLRGKPDGEVVLRLQ